MRHRSLTTAATLVVLSVCSAVVPAAAAEPDPAPVERQVIIKVDLAETSIDAVNAAAGTTVVAESISGDGSFLLDVPVGVSTEATIAAIDAVTGVDFVVPNSVVAPPEVEQSRIYAWRIYAWAADQAVPAPSRYAVDAVRLDAAASHARGAGVVVAIVDTAVQLDHPALAAAVVPGADLVDGDLDPTESLNGIDDDGDGSVDEGAGHGTHVAGIVHRVAPEASLMVVRVLDDDGSGTLWNATEGMYWAAAHGARVVNMSLGTHNSARPLREAVTALAQQGVLVVAAAGNEGKDRPMFPAAAPEALAVGSVGAGDVVSPFSNIGRWIDVVAPGEHIHSAYSAPPGSWAMNSGTSMASPWVAGEAALLLSVRRDLTVAGLTAAIKSGAATVDAANPALVGQLGAGRIDIAASLARV